MNVLALLLFTLAASTHSEPVRSLRYGHAVAANGNGALVAWMDSRPRADADASFQVRAMRFDAQGRALDERDLSIAVRGSNVHVATDGFDFMVAYDRPALGVQLVRVPGSGGAPVPVDLRLDTAHKELFYAAGHYFVFTGDLYVIDREGNLVRPKIALFRTFEPRDMRIADAGDGRVLFVWSRFLGQLSSAMVPIDQLLDPAFEDFDAPVDLRTGWVHGLVRGPAGFALLTTDYVAYKLTVRITMLDRDGGIATPPQDLFEFPSFAQPIRDFDGTDLFLTRLGTGYALITDHRSQRKHGAAFLRLDESGRPLDTKFTRVSDEEGDVAAAGASDGTLWIGYEDGDATRVQRIDAAGGLLLTFPGPIASRARASQLDARIERCASFDLVVWQEVAMNHSITKARRFSHEGEPLGAAFAIDSRASEYEASVVCGSDSALATWSVGAERRAAMIGASGAPARVAPASSGSPTVFDGSHFAGPVFGTATVGFQRWTENGVPVDEEAPQFPLGEGNVHSAAFGWNGTDFLLAWFSDERLNILRFNASLTPLGPPVTVSVPLDFSGVKGLTVSASPDQWLVAWVGGYLDLGWATPARDNWFVTTVRISADGSFLDADQAVVNESWIAYAGLSQVSWNGARWELLTPRELGSLAADGTMQRRALLDDAASLNAVSPAGSRRLVVYTRIDPIDGAADLFGEMRSEREWQSPRRRAARP